MRDLFELLFQIIEILARFDSSLEPAATRHGNVFNFRALEKGSIVVSAVGVFSVLL